MMLDAIKQRRSVRQYKPDPVPEEMLREIAEAAFSAPSANNVRPWHLIVVTDKAKRAALAQVHQYAGFSAEAPVIMVMCGNECDSEHWWIEDCAAATENAMVQAAALGLGTCWIGIRGSDERGYEREAMVRELLAIPDAIRVLCAFSLGFPAGGGSNKGPGPMERVHREKW
ncbi:MAG: nitroreductase family protein [Armatimonadetes bacterium]|nr:nitroreductase family protein [Armatimonadota bacterium]